MMKPFTRILLRLLTCTLFAGCTGAAAGSGPAKVTGTVWQVDHATVDPRGDWERIGARTLLVQWIAVDGIAFVPGSELPQAPVLPDWQRIAGEPWAGQVILGLAGRFDEAAARSEVAALGALSQRLARLPIPLNVVGWYFPVEIDPTWSEGARLREVLEGLPRPLWVSAYDSANVGPRELAERLTQWLPPDVGVFFQDGVGVHAREPRVAREYADILATRLGRQRVRLIVEAFRPQSGGFRAATATEIRSQLDAYAGYETYLFDGPHYVPRTTVDELARPAR
jgi:hypothetical protein